MMLIRAGPGGESSLRVSNGRLSEACSHAKMIVVDPASRVQLQLPDLFLSKRAGADIAFPRRMIRYAIENTGSPTTTCSTTRTPRSS